MHRHRRTTTIVAALAALALPVPLAGIAQGDPSRPGPDDLGPSELSGVVVEAAREAAEQQGSSATRSTEQAQAASDQEIGDALDAATEALVADGAVGVTARVESPDLQWRGSAGSREVDQAPPAQPQDRFRVASITKPMVATLVMQEVEAGSLDLDTRVNTIVPGLFPRHHDVTVEHLLTHRSGVQTGTDHLLLTRIQDPTQWDQFLTAIGLDYTPEQHLAVVNGLPWHFRPDRGFSYSNAGYVALGMVLEEVTGQSVEELLQERVLAPAGLQHTSYPDDPGTNGPFLVGAAYTGEAWLGGLGWVSLDGFDPDVFGASGAVVSTTKDLNTFTEALLTGELVSAATVEDMVTPRTTGQAAFPDYGLGVYRLPDPCTGEWLYGHDGASYGTMSIALSSPDGTRQLSLAVTGRDLTQPLPAYDVNELLVPMLLATC